MNEEIERLIFDLEGCCGMFDYMLTPLENSLLVSYIKDLQQENQQLKEELKYTVPIVEHNKIVSKKIKENQQLKEKIDKATDMLIVVYGGNDEYYVKTIEKARNILKGSENNE